MKTIAHLEVRSLDHQGAWGQADQRHADRAEKAFLMKFKVMSQTIWEDGEMVLNQIESGLGHKAAAKRAFGLNSNREKSEFRQKPESIVINYVDEDK